MELSTSAWNVTIGTATSSERLINTPKIKDVSNWFLMVFLMVSYFVTVVTNLALLVMIIKKHRLHTVNCFLMCSLAVSDTILATAYNLTALPWLWLGVYVLGFYWCQIQGALIVACSTVSIASISGIAADRYYYISRPLRYHHWVTTKKAFLFIAASWLLGFTIGVMPYVLLTQYHEDEDLLSCHESSAPHIIIVIVCKVPGFFAVSFSYFYLLKECTKQVQERIRFSATRTRLQRQSFTARALRQSQQMLFKHAVTTTLGPNNENLHYIKPENQHQMLPAVAEVVSSTSRRLSQASRAGSQSAHSQKNLRRWSTGSVTSGMFFIQSFYGLSPLKKANTPSKGSFTSDNLINICTTKAHRNLSSKSSSQSCPTSPYVKDSRRGGLKPKTSFSLPNRNIARTSEKLGNLAGSVPKHNTWTKGDGEKDSWEGSSADSNKDQLQPKPGTSSDASQGWPSQVKTFPGSHSQGSFCNGRHSEVLRKEELSIPGTGIASTASPIKTVSSRRRELKSLSIHEISDIDEKDRSRERMKSQLVLSDKEGPNKMSIWDFLDEFDTLSPTYSMKKANPRIFFDGFDAQFEGSFSEVSQASSNLADQSNRRSFSLSLRDSLDRDTKDGGQAMKSMGDLQSRFNKLRRKSRRICNYEVTVDDPFSVKRPEYNKSFENLEQRRKMSTVNWFWENKVRRNSEQAAGYKYQAEKTIENEKTHSIGTKTNDDLTMTISSLDPDGKISLRDVLNCADESDTMDQMKNTQEKVAKAIEHQTRYRKHFARWHAVSTLTAILLLFYVIYLPINVLGILKLILPKSPEVTLATRYITIMCVSLSVMTNPFIFGLTNRDVKRAFQVALGTNQNRVAPVAAPLALASQDWRNTQQNTSKQN